MEMGRPMNLKGARMQAWEAFVEAGGALPMYESGEFDTTVQAFHAGQIVVFDSILDLIDGAPMQPIKRLPTKEGVEP